MRKKLIFGSIIAVAILVGVSLTSVVGYQSVKSNNITSSPLFDVRTNEAVSTEKINIIREYIGKGKETRELFSNINDNRISIQKIIELIQGMDDSEIEQLMNLIDRHYLNNKLVENLPKEELIRILKNNWENQYDLNEIIDNLNIFYNKGYQNPGTVDNWNPGCFLEVLVVIFILIVHSIFFALLLIYMFIFKTGTFTCSPGSFCQMGLCKY